MVLSAMPRSSSFFSSWPTCRRARPCRRDRRPRPVLPSRLRLQVREDVHAGRVEVAEERLVGLVLPVDEVERRGEELLVDRLHALLGQRAGVLDLAVGGATGCTPRGPKLLPELRVLRIVGVLRLLLGVEVVEVAEELVEAVVGRQELVLVAEVVLAELAGGVAERLQELGDASGPPPAGRCRRRAARPWSARCGSATGR